MRRERKLCSVLHDAGHKETDLKVFVVVEKSMSCQKKDGRGHAHPFFFWYDNDKDLKAMDDGG